MEDNVATADGMPERALSTPETISIALSYHGSPHTFTLPSNATISDLSTSIANTLSIPPPHQKLIISKLGLLKPPFKDPLLPLTTLLNHKITLHGSTAAEVSLLSQTASDAHSRSPPPRKSTVKAYKSHDRQREADEALYTFTTLRPLPYLPHPERSLAFLQRLKSDPGIRATMRTHKWSVPLLTEMNPAEYTQSNHEGTSRTLGLNRNAGEVIELRLRTDAYDGYRDYKTIRNTLCHELAHNVHGPHDRNFWELCKQVEKEVEGADWKSGGRTVGREEFYEGGEDGEEEVHDHGGWEGGEYVLGVGAAGGGGGVDGTSQSQGVSRREILARAAEERIKRFREQSGGGNGEGASSGGSGS